MPDLILFKALAIDLYVGDSDFSMLASQLRKHADLTSEADTQDLTLLHYAAISGNKKLLDLLLPCCGHIIDMQNSAGDTALLMAAKQNHREICDVLISAGADQTVLTKTSKKWKEGLTAGDIAKLYTEGRVLKKIIASDLTDLDTFKLNDNNFSTVLETFTISEISQIYQNPSNFSYVYPIIIMNLSRDPSSFLGIDQSCNADRSRKIFEGMLAKQISSGSIVNLINNLSLERLDSLTQDKKVGEMIIDSLDKNPMPIFDVREEKQDFVKELITGALVHSSRKIGQELSRALHSFYPTLSSEIAVERVKSEFGKLAVSADEVPEKTNTKTLSKNQAPETGKELSHKSWQPLPKRDKFVNMVKKSKSVTTELI